MSIWSIPSRVARLQAGPSLRHFTTTCRRAATVDPDPDSHYDILNVPPDATPVQIKKSFYSLSKLHHPDRNPSDPHAPRRFIRISEAYSVLSTPAKRAAYDRDQRHSHARSTAHRAPSHQSYHGTGPGPAGGRPASGLSRRRATTSARGSFRGPPPSFYGQGGYGAHADRRQAAHDQTTNRAEQRARGHSSSASFTAGGEGEGAGAAEFGPRSAAGRHIRNDVPHFDSFSHERSHMRQEQRRVSRRLRDHATAPEDPGQDSSGTSFGFVLVVTAIVAFGAMVPMMLGAGRESTQKKRAKRASADGASKA